MVFVTFDPFNVFLLNINLKSLTVLKNFLMVVLIF